MGAETTAMRGRGCGWRSVLDSWTCKHDLADFNCVSQHASFSFCPSAMLMSEELN